MNKNLQQCINEILNNGKIFSKGDFFDSHTILNQILLNKEYYQIYLEEFPRNITVAQYHGLIAQKIYDTGCVEKIITDGKDLLIKSQTIFGELSNNHLWKKI